MKFVGHNLVYVTQMVLRYHNERIFGELRPFIDQITTGLPESLRSDLLRAQEACLIVPTGEYPLQINVGLNVYDYVFRGENLEFGSKDYALMWGDELRDAFDNSEEFDMAEFLSLFWLKRRSGLGIASAVQVSPAV